MTKTKERSTKTLKGQLFGAVAMMVVAAIALGTSTYAWFVNNNTTEVQPMQFTVSTATSLQVAVGLNPAAAGYADVTGPKFTEYKNVIANADINGLLADKGAGWTNMFSDGSAYRMQPATVTDTSVATLTPSFFKSNSAMNGNLLSEFVPVEGSDLGEGSVKKIPLSFLASTDMDVFFGNPGAGTAPSAITFSDLITATETADVAGQPTHAEQAEAIKKALHIAIVPKDADAGAPVIFQFDDGGDHLIGSTYNTDFSKVTKAGAVSGIAGDATILSAIKDMQNEATGLFAAIAAVDSNKFVTEVNKQTAITATGAAKYSATVTKAADGTITTEAPAVDGKSLFTLKTNTAVEVDVYIWLEGADQDCISALSAYEFKLDLPFAGVAKTTPVTP